MSAALVGIAGLVLGVILVWLEGRRQGRAAAKAQAARRQIEAEQTRRRIEDEIEQDTNLADRARRAGLVRPER